MDFCYLFNISAIFLIICLLASFIYLIKLRQKIGQKLSKNKIIGIFHPSCNAGGGGEKVLFCILKALENLDFDIIIYSGEPENIDIFQLAKNRFNLNIDESRIKVVQILDKNILAPKKRLTILIQILGQIYFSFLAITQYPCDYFIDSQGFAFSYFIVKLLQPNCKIAAYVHYPYVSQDMINAVSENKSTVNYKKTNKTKLEVNMKIFYYKIIFMVYKLMKFHLDLVFTNSTWTSDHINQIWNVKSNILYPPCNVQDLLNLDVSQRQNLIISFSQIRPEKNHQSQLQIFKKLKDQTDCDYKMIILGSVRDLDDQLLLNDLQEQTNKLGLKKDVEFKINIPYSEIKQIFQIAQIGIHTMQCEHFGISIVEMMAAGLITIAHNSAGAKLDIIQTNENRGFLCDNDQNYLDVLKYLTSSNQIQIIENARQHVQKFQDQQFIDQFQKQIQKSFLINNKLN